MKTAICVLLFAYVVEILQYVNLIRYLGLQQSTSANIIMGNYFEWIDMVAYTIGIGIVLLLERPKGRL
jgi:hypothetical protein